jgi:predicted kinase
MREVVLLMGNIGCGKTTLAKKYVEQGFLAIDQDFLREMFGAGKYIYTPETEAIIMQLSRQLLLELLNTDKNIVIDGCFVSRQKRQEILDTIHIHSSVPTHTKLIVLPRCPREVCIARRMKNPRGFSKKVWMSVWKKFNDKWDKPGMDEDFDYIEVQLYKKERVRRGRRMRVLHKACNR